MKVLTCFSKIVKTLCDLFCAVHVSFQLVLNPTDIFPSEFRPHYEVKILSSLSVRKSPMNCIYNGELVW